MPKLKQFGDEYSAVFQDASVVAAYRHRAPYPIATFDHLIGLMDKRVSPRRILDVGCGRGEITSMLLHALLHTEDGIDAVDISAAMIEMGKRMSYGSDARINWINGAIEQVELNPPYALMVAAASIHWMDWEATLPRLTAALSRDGYLAIVEARPSPNAWDKELGPIQAHYSMNQDFEPYNMLTVAAELQRRGLFEQYGVIEVEPVLHRQSINDWIEAIHAGNGFSRDRMEEDVAREFDRSVRDVLVRHCPQGEVEQWVGARVVYGKPLAHGE